MLKKVIERLPPVLLRDIGFVHSLCLQGAVAHVLRMQSLRKQPLTQSLVALTLHRQDTEIGVLNVPKAGKSVGGEE
jgi:hypothetical protein